jgi:CubicO group peptidase (beta-lactamase class C family)
LGRNKIHAYGQGFAFMIALTVLIPLGVPLTARGQIAPGKFKGIGPVVQKMIDAKEIAGAVVMVSHQKQIVHFDAQGLRDLEEQLPMEKDTLFRIYSMTKPITTVAAMMLVEQGRFKLDDPVENYLTEFKGVKVFKEGKAVTTKNKMTIRHLMTHTAGFTYGYFGKTAVDAMYKKDHPHWRRNNQEMSQKLATYPLLYEPGTVWHYSLATDVLGALVERVSGQSLAVFFEQYIFKPLQMNDTAFYVPKKKVQRFASVYGKQLKLSDKYSQSNYNKKGRLQSAGGGLVSTASDYMNFCQMLLNEGDFQGTRLLKKESIKAMTQNQLPPPMKTYEHFGFGLGFLIQIQDGGSKGHLGEYSWNGIACTHFWISPKDQLIVIALSQRRPLSMNLKNRLKPVIYDALK